MEWHDGPLILCSLVGSFLLVIGELDLILPWLLIMNVARIAAFKMSELLYEHVVASCWNVENRTTNLDLLSVEGVLQVESDLVERLASWTEGLEDLP